jgi:hypothetical protein
MPAAMRRAFIGFILGILGGGLALMIAIGRANLVGDPGAGSLLRDRPELPHAVLAAFGLGGLLLGLLSPLRRTPLCAFGLGLLAAAVSIVTVFVGLAGFPTGWSHQTWWSAAVATLLLGMVIGAQLQPSDSQSA